MHPASLSEDELLSQCEVRFQRRGGPGGQHRNKVSTAVVIEHIPTGIRAEANETRSQDTNRIEAIQRLRIELAIFVRRSKDLDSPSTLWRSRVRSGRIHISWRHSDYPAMLAEALDQWSTCDHDIARAAERLAVTPAQLVKLLRHEPRTLVMVNEKRFAEGLPKLR